MNRTVHKCLSCRKSIADMREGQKYCSNACRQAAYRKRKAQAQPAKKQAVERDLFPALVPTTCDHCKGTFWAKMERARFCSTSCRSLYHRSLKAALPHALATAYGLPQNTIQHLIKTEPVRDLQTWLSDSGYVYSHPQRSWVQQKGASA